MTTEVTSHLPRAAGTMGVGTWRWTLGCAARTLDLHMHTPRPAHSTRTHAIPTVHTHTTPCLQYTHAPRVPIRHYHVFMVRAPRALSFGLLLALENCTPRDHHLSQPSVQNPEPTPIRLKGSTCQSPFPCPSSPSLC